MPADEEDEGMGTSGEIRREDLEAADSSAEWRSESERLLNAIRAERAELERLQGAESEVEKQLRGEEASGYGVYLDLITDELAVQDKRKASFEQRGLAVITTSGVLVTLLFALAAFSTKRAQTFVLPGAARSWLFVGLVLFLVSAFTALLTNAPLIYQAVPAERIRERLREKPLRSGSEATRDVAFTQLDTLEAAKKLNGLKGWALSAALLFEALAVGCVAVAIAIIL